MNVIIVDDKAVTGSDWIEVRPNEKWLLNDDGLYSNHRQFASSLEQERTLGNSALVALHINDDEAIRRTSSGVRLLGAVAKSVCSRGGRVLFFSGGRICDLDSDLKGLLDEARSRLTQADFREGKHFGAVDWHDIDSDAIGRLVRQEEVITNSWFIDQLFKDVSSDTRDALATLEALAGYRAGIPQWLIENLRRMNIAHLRRRLLEESRASDSDVSSIENLITWLSGDWQAQEVVPLEAKEWVAAARRALQSCKKQREDLEVFERTRDHLSHSLFGNDFAQKLGAKGEFLDGYWRSLSGSPQPGDEDSRDSVEAALHRWPKVRKSLERFIAAPWPVENARDRRGALKALVASLDDLVEETAKLAYENEGDKGSFRSRFVMSVDEIRSALRCLRVGGNNGAV